MSDESKVVSIRDGAPSARLKFPDWSDKRARCEHKQVEIWAKEPIIECSMCGAVVDPYEWLRARCRDWHSLHASLEHKRDEISREIKQLSEALRVLRGEYKSEAEKRAAERSLHIWTKDPTMRGRRR